MRARAIAPTLNQNMRPSFMTKKRRRHVLMCSPARQRGRARTKCRREATSPGTAGVSGVTASGESRPAKLLDATARDATGAGRIRTLLPQPSRSLGLNPKLHPSRVRPAEEPKETLHYRRGSTYAAPTGAEVAPSGRAVA